jgi:hypothetical protein
MIKTATGFSFLKGVTIARAKADGINQVTLFDADGEHFYVIEGEVGSLGISQLSCTKHKVAKYKRAATRAPKLVLDNQPFILEDQTLD